MESDEYYKTKEVYYRMNRARKEAILSLLEKNGRGLILDVACATGELGETIKNVTQYKVWGADISSNFLETAGKKLDRTFCFDISSDFSSWPAEIKTEKFDKIILSEILEHLFFPERLLKNLKNICVQDAEIIITVPNVLFWKNRLKILFGNFDYTDQGLMDRGHIHFFSWESLEKLVNDAGFQIVDTKNFIPTRGTKWLGKIFPGLFAFQFIVKAKLNVTL
ncbi:MAG: hypothetical protein A2174_02355 [Candidatus Portnoybacteria bacterium RBG_13_41_18]|uniref:Methyltransferase domain-containing protein n=1 Tax=Candidatus Portnoybacteria bacterium RBG_13_41_18 TaxID=1801991 RepID=A0A1G2F9T1_9BACT|nr:MAG: hypothetical protein A2174_02355 [Candidatus Portnoybacteria bacterium RBG_13_41_18]